jgi:uncharacterized protein
MTDQSNKWQRHLVLLTTVVGTQTTETNITNHILYLKDLEDREELEVCGPFDDRSGGMIILKNMTREEAERIAARDPFVTSGIRSITIKSFEKSCWENNHLGRLS